MKKISTEKAPRPAGHYSQAVVSGGVVYVAGQLGGDPAQPGEPAGGAGAQTKQAMANVAAVLAAAGSGLGNILQSTIYVTDIELWAEVNEAYAEAMGEHRPARAVVPIGPLRPGYLVEIQVIAALA